MTARRLETGGTWIDRTHPVSFVFDGRELAGYDGDTLASALLANGVVGGFVSPILGRPRGVMTEGPEEPNAFVEVSEPYFDLIAPATMVPLVDGLVARSVAGVGRLPTASVPAPRVEHRHRHVDALIVGASVQGVDAAAAEAIADRRVLLCDERHVGAWRVPTRDGFTVLAGASVLGLYDDGYAIVHERSLDVERLWHVRAGSVVLATGAHERPIAFAGNDRPGVMLAGAAGAYVERFGVLPGERALVFTTNDSAYRAAQALRDAGAEVAAIVDARRVSPAQEAAREDGFGVVSGAQVTGTSGEVHVSAGLAIDAEGREITVGCDLVAVSGGWNPALQLWRAIGGTMRYDAERACFVPDEGPPWLSVVGAAAGDGLPAAEPLWFVAADDSAEHFVDLQRDQTVADVAAALDDGLRSVEHVKRATYIGTAVDQGRTSGALTAEIVNQLLGADPGAQGPTGARPPWTPVAFDALAGPYHGELFDPIRLTPIHARHVDRGAVFEDVGQWKRPWYFPLDGESMQDAVLRECAAVRTGVGMMDASTLGKIEVVGPDAGDFLDRMYTNAMSTLAVGRIRYGLMLGLDGMVFDDGVAMRLAEDRYLVTTTTGGAGRVLDRFEEWLQTEWPDLQVYCTSVTEQWSTVAVAGPRSREVLRSAGSDIDVSNDAFPFMTWQGGTVAGVDARVARVSFSGELAFEVNVAGYDGPRVWDALIATGAALGITPYGTEAMHVLRAEKGFVIVGQDTDGTVTPFDLGMAWIVNGTKGDFIGRRSLARIDLTRSGRKQLIGLLPDDPAELTPEGSQLVAAADAEAAPPVPMLGHVTSSYRSAALQRTFALALLTDGASRHGEAVAARSVGSPLAIAATVTAPNFYDRKGTRRDG